MIICISLYLVNTTIFFPCVCYNTTCFGPLCGPSSGVSRVISHRIAWRGGGRDLVMWVFLLCNALRNISVNPLNLRVARGISCFCFMIRTAYSRIVVHF